MGKRETLVDFDEKARLAQSILENRRDRQDTLPAEMFGEFAWDALLHLFIADAASERLTGNQLAKRIKCPPQVMARWLMYLSQQQLIIGDGRGDLSDSVTMSPKALDALEVYLAATQALAERLFNASYL